jgi:signal peptide peptidase SppA
VNPLLLQNREWLIKPEALESLSETVDAYFKDGKNVPEGTTDSPVMKITDGIATISIDGPLMRNPGILARIFMGATDSNVILDAIIEATDRPDVKAVMLDIDSPGGTVSGTPEMAAAVADLAKVKPVYAFSAGLMCSAAYWIASQARAIYVTPSATVGSIGVVQTVLDKTDALAKQGYRVEVFSVGKFKAMGAPGTTLTDEQRELIQSNLGEIAGEFHDAVLSRGRKVPAEAMEGQTFRGKHAEAVNLAKVVKNRAEAFHRLNSYAAAVDTKPLSPTRTYQFATTMTLEEQFAKLQADHKAQSDLLNEAASNLTNANTQVAALNANLVTVKGELATANGTITTLQGEVAKLNSEKEDFDKKVQTEVARVVASTGTTSAVATGSEKADPKVISFADFGKLSVSDQNAFFRDGGKIQA